MADKQYIRGKDCMVFVTTENADAAVDLTGPTAKAADPSTFEGGMASCDGVGALGLTSIDADSKDAQGNTVPHQDRIMDVVGVSYTASGEDETITLEFIKDRTYLSGRWRSYYYDGGKVPQLCQAEQARGEVWGH